MNFLTSLDGQTTDSKQSHNLSSTHEEADTQVILLSIHVDKTTTTAETDIIVRYPDTADVFALLVAFNQKLLHPEYFDTGTGKNERFFTIQTLCEKITIHIQGSILGLPALTGCDVDSAF